MPTGAGSGANGAVVEALLPPGVADAIPQKLCEKLARTHYENFTVGSVLLPKALRRDVCSVYAYCRVCDDLADETGDPELSARLLEWWREELHECYGGRPRHPVFVALRESIERRNLPMQPFDDLITAFLRDQQVTRYETFDDLLGYCRNSANPVGRLFLHLLGYADEARQRLSDFTCTALQLANFWQDIGPDYARGRIYIPQEDMRHFGYTEDELRNHVVNASFVRLVRFEIARTRELFARGAALHRLVEGVGAADIELFTRAGLAVLSSIERHNCDVFRHRCSVSAATRFRLLAGWCVRNAVARCLPGVREHSSRLA